MNRNNIRMAAVFIVATSWAQVAAQFPVKFPVKIPGMETSKKEKPKAVAGQPEQKLNTVQDQTAFLSRPQPNSKPIFLKDSLEIRTTVQTRYWKFPNVADYTSWLPQISLDVFYDDSSKLRYRAEWFHADGSPWFDEMLRYGFLSNDKTVQIQSDTDGELFNTKASASVGSCGVKVTDTKTGEVVVQAKFKVHKLLHFPGDAKYKNRHDFYVDNDWSLKTGYVGYEYLDSATPMLVVSLWFKDRLNDKDFEARLYRNGEEMTSTDDGGNILASTDRKGGCEMFPDRCVWQLRRFQWDKLRVRNGKVNPYFLETHPGLKFTDENAGAYSVKVFYRGTQVREANFTINEKGLLAQNAFANQIYLTDYKVIIPVKVSGTLDKWNAATPETEMFYGNPINNF